MPTCQICGSRPTRRTRAGLEALGAALAEVVEELRPATVRQVFYQAVVRGIVPKCETHGYRHVQRRLVAMREEGSIPYGWITDTIRMVRGHARYRGIEEYAGEVASRYRRDYWADSETNVEIWLEKDALAGVLAPVVVEESGLALYVTRGFSSVTYLQSAADQIEADGRQTFVYLLTDYDPSGLSIAESVERALLERTDEHPPVVERLAVTRGQIEAYELPTRPTKTTDARARRFFEEHGTESVELDALPPDVLRSLVREAIERHMDPRRLESLKMVELEEREGIARLLQESA
jgi:hypothetical protein